MLVKLGFVAMSIHLPNSSPSQTMTFAQFQKIKDREAAIAKLERIANKNVHNCLRLMKHAYAHHVSFFRLSSKIIPLANHSALLDWNYMESLRESLNDIRQFLKKKPMRIDFHPDHFVVLNSQKEDVFKNACRTLLMHRKLLRGMGINPVHRCVLHVGAAYQDKEKALELFVENWGEIPVSIQEMVMLENDDSTFTMNDTLFLCEKLNIPLVFDLHHQLVNGDEHPWEQDWERVVQTWNHAFLPIKMHISTPRDEKDRRAHADYIDADMFLSFLRKIKGSVSEIHCMIEAKQKDEALFQLMRELQKEKDVEMIDGGSFYLK
ncbi:MAG: UV DNA damage repair endonuclease UvsE [Bacillaceae bacterium]